MDIYIEIADDINRRLSAILTGLRQGTDDRFRNDHGCIRWDVVEDAIHQTVMDRLTTSEPRPVTAETTPELPSGQLIRAGTFRCADETEPVHGYLVASTPDAIRRVACLPMYQTVTLAPSAK